MMSNKAHQEEFIREAGLWFKNGLLANNPDGYENK